MSLRCVIFLSAAGLVACSNNPASNTGETPNPTGAESGGTVRVDGSSTVFPITEAVAEEFQAANPGTRVTIGVSGTGGGMKKFCAGETDITGASRPIKPVEIETCKAAGIDFIELAVAYDGIAVVTHTGADWVEHLTVEELKTMFAPESQDTVKTWKQVRAGFPDKELHLFGAGVDSGTYDYFTKAIVGKEHSSRGDFTSSEDDNVLVQGVSTDPSALGFMGLAYYEENAEKLKLIPVDDGVADNGDGPIAPTLETVKDGTYQPLSRPIFIYVASPSAERKLVQDFLHFYLGTEGQALIQEVGYIPLATGTYAKVRERFDTGTTGSIFAQGGSQVGLDLDAVLQ